MPRSDALERFAIMACDALPPFRGKTSLGWRLMERARRCGRLSGTWPLTLRDGSRLELPRSSRMTWQVAADGYYDTHVIAALLPYVQDGSIVLDVGASLGIWTVQLARVARARGAFVHSFEPNPGNIPWLMRNIRMNDLQDIVTVHAIGLGDTNAQMAFGSTEGGVGNGAVLSPNDATSVEYTVPLRRLDDVPFDRRVGLIKLDIEGYEPSALRGAIRLIERDHPVIFGEFSPPWLKARGEDVNSALESLGYAPFHLQSRRSRPWQPANGTVVQPLSLPISDLGDLLLIPRP